MDPNVMFFIILAIETSTNEPSVWMASIVVFNVKVLNLAIGLTIITSGIHIVVITDTR